MPTPTLSSDGIILLSSFGAVHDNRSITRVKKSASNVREGGACNLYHQMEVYAPLVSFSYLSTFWHARLSCVKTIVLVSEYGREVPGDILLVGNAISVLRVLSTPCSYSSYKTQRHVHDSGPRCANMMMLMKSDARCLWQADPRNESVHLTSCSVFAAFDASIERLLVSRSYVVRAVLHAI